MKNDDDIIAAFRKSEAYKEALARQPAASPAPSVERAFEVLAKTMERQHSESLALIRDVVDGQRELLNRALEQQLALISPDALRLSVMLGGNRAPPGGPPTRPQVPRPHPGSARDEDGYEEEDRQTISPGDIEAEIGKYL